MRAANACMHACMCEPRLCVCEREAGRPCADHQRALLSAGRNAEQHTHDGDHEGSHVCGQGSTALSGGAQSIPSAAAAPVRPWGRSCTRKKLSIQFFSHQNYLLMQTPLYAPVRPWGRSCTGSCTQPRLQSSSCDAPGSRGTSPACAQTRAGRAACTRLAQARVTGVSSQRQGHGVVKGAERMC